jgi:hypothetical protein
MSLEMAPSGISGCRDKSLDLSSSAPASRLRGIPLYLAIGAIIFYCVAAYRITISKVPFSDEGSLASPAYNLAFHGFMGTTVLEPTGTWLNGTLHGIHQYTYWVMPLHILAQAAWYRIFGFGLTQMRLLSAAWGAIALIAWYCIVERITRNPLAGALTMLLLSVDFTFLWSAADGRMDMMCVGLGSAALAAYLLLREKHFLTAFFCANCLAAASVFTHPNGVVWISLLAVLTLLYDRRSLRPANLAAITPYAILLAGWGWYIARRPDYFLAQFAANLNIPGGRRGSGFLHPLLAIQREVGRYTGHFGSGVWAKPVPHFAIAIPILLCLICGVALIQFWKTREQGLGTILLLLSVCVFWMTFGDSLKADYYLGMIMPLYAATAATSVALNKWKDPWSYARAGLVAGLLLMQVNVLNAKLVENPLHDQFEPAVDFLKSVPASQITADSVFAFELGYSRINDDMRLGMRSGQKPKLFVIDPWYLMTWQYVYPYYDPQASAYIRNLIHNEYHEVYGSDSYFVFERNDSPSLAPTAFIKH